MAHPRSRTFPRTKKIDHTVWELSQGGALAQSAGSSANGFSTVGTSPTTLMRMRGTCEGWIDAAGAPGRLIAVNWGIIKVPEGSSSVTVEPFGDGNAPWIVYGSCHLGYEEMVTDVVDVPGLTFYRWVVDGKAMRKIPPDTFLQMVVTNTSVGSAAVLNFTWNIRWLQGF